MPGRRRRWLAYVFAVILGGGGPTGPSAARQVPFAEPPAISTLGTVLRAGGAFVVVSPGDLTLRAGQRVELQDGFGVQGGAFTAEVDPGLEP